jgi:hypothetical protein
VDDPGECSRRHVTEVLRASRSGDGHLAIDVDSIADARPEWPAWPQVALERLVGPPNRRLAHMDLRWLHRFQALVSVLDHLVAVAGGPVGGPSALNLLVERAVMLGYHGWGTSSAGTSCRLLPTADGWVALNLPREADLDAVPALVQADSASEIDAWAQAEQGVAGLKTAEVIERTELLGIPAAEVPTRWNADPQRVHRGEAGGPVPMLVTDHRSAKTASTERPLVVDLTSLWAGPLAGWYLARAGAEVIKVESTRRLDGARRGTPAFYRHLNDRKTVLDVDLGAADGVAALVDLIERADIVLEASRPRAMAGFGIEPADHIAKGTIWCSITGYGRTGPAAGRVAFGDDAAVAGGLVTTVDGGPWFIGDAAADPVSGVTAATGALALWLRGRCGLVDVAMRDAVAHLTGGGPVHSQAE